MLNARATFLEYIRRLITELDVSLASVCVLQKFDERILSEKCGRKAVVFQSPVNSSEATRSRKREKQYAGKTFSKLEIEREFIQNEKVTYEREK
ncbi:hypothetical protein WN51_03832 [Melipona quadrifasciata]|uniref:Uncharacterized protein n=1 Tax=Melipona quadrifasciata TaxID=166423 RepID=A0A0M9AAY9_9HYME|nr:hypothetical protein WN51_03832 [Melipona quadrifasciata]